MAAAVGGLRYVVRDGQTGYLVEGHDPADHAGRMLQILRDPALAGELGTSAAGEALRFTWDATATELAGIYRELVGGRVHSCVTSANAVVPRGVCRFVTLSFKPLTCRYSL